VTVRRSSVDTEAVVEQSECHDEEQARTPRLC
jgi:hypothetical protein